VGASAACTRISDGAGSVFATVGATVMAGTPVAVAISSSAGASVGWIVGGSIVTGTAVTMSVAVG